MDKFVLECSFHGVVYPNINLGGHTQEWNRFCMKIAPQNGLSPNGIQLIIEFQTKLGIFMEGLEMFGWLIVGFSTFQIYTRYARKFYFTVSLSVHTVSKQKQQKHFCSPQRTYKVMTDYSRS